MYRVVVRESMTRCLRRVRFYAGFDRTQCCLPVCSGRVNVRLWLWPLLLLMMVGLAGCGSKNLSGDDPFAVVDKKSSDDGASMRGSYRKAGTVYLPADDGKPLSPEELNAFMSEGVVDRNLSSEDMHDVLLHFKNLVHTDRFTVEKNVERGQYYMPFIEAIFREKGLPQEIAHVAFIESGYNPKARSSTGATGMWQFVSATGKYYGMQQDWWMDERRDPYQATRAAADYLKKLHTMFNDWGLAVTAYNAGEGKISRGLAATGTRNFFDLRRKNDRISTQKDRLTEENMQYLPKFLAVCKIMRNLSKLGFSSVDTSRSPRVTELTVKPGTDLMALAKTSGLDWEEFSRHNPAYQRYVSPPGRSAKVYIPQHLARQAQAFLSSPRSAAASASGWRSYTIRKGDTLASISRKNGVPVAELRRINTMSEPLRAGKVLKIPGSSQTRIAANSSSPTPEPAVSRTSRSSTRSAVAVHEVKSGDTIYSISNRYDIDQDDLLAANNMRAPHLRLGQKLTIPRGAQAPAPRMQASAPRMQAQASSQKASSPSRQAKQAAPSKKNPKIVSYQVQQGDSLWAIARKFNISPTALLSLNNMSRDDRLRPGDTVRVAIN